MEKETIFYPENQREKMKSDIDRMKTRGVEARVEKGKNAKGEPGFLLRWIVKET